MFFFFSSRRRHTRYWRDWSSDVCSSDLFGFIGRAFAKDLPMTTLKTFYEVFPPEMLIGKPKRIGQTGLIFKICSKDPALPSEIYLDYILDKQSGRSHRSEEHTSELQSRQ